MFWRGGAEKIACSQRKVESSIKLYCTTEHAVMIDFGRWGLYYTGAIVADGSHYAGFLSVFDARFLFSRSETPKCLFRHKGAFLTEVDVINRFLDPDILSKSTVKSFRLFLPLKIYATFFSWLDFRIGFQRLEVFGGKNPETVYRSIETLKGVLIHAWRCAAWPIKHDDRLSWSAGCRKKKKLTKGNTLTVIWHKGELSLLAD